MDVISFDRAAGYYDETRGLPGPVLERVVDQLAAELSGRGPALEVGVGTGRIAVPLRERGVELLGSDIAPAMLERLVANAGRRPFPLLVADARSLPLANGRLGAVLVSHVLHLIADWQAAVDDMVRVMRPGGVLLVDFGGGVPGPWSALAQAAMQEHGVRSVRPGLSVPGPLAAHLGVPARPLGPVRFTSSRSLGRDLEQWRAQIHSWTWPYEPGQMRVACDAVVRAAAAEGWPLEREVELERTVQWWAFELSGS